METRYDSRLYPISRLLWFEDISTDKYWYVIQYLPKFSKILDFFSKNNTFFNPDLLSKKQYFKWYAMSILCENPKFLDRKFYN
jgi:hypothetical protein